MDRHLNVRRHSIWNADVEPDMLADPRYFDSDGKATAAFDQWMCDNGDEIAIEFDFCNEDEDLYFEANWECEYDEGYNCGVHPTPTAPTDA